VGAADLRTHGANIEPILRECMQRCPIFVGVRCSAAHSTDANVTSFATDANTLRDPNFIKGFEVLQLLNLLFDLWVYGHQLNDVYDLAIQYLSQTIVLDHCGTPVGMFNSNNLSAETTKTSWRNDLAKIATHCPNVFVKIGDGSLPVLGSGFAKRDVLPGSTEVADKFKELYAWTIETFRAERCMLEVRFFVFFFP